MSASRSVLVELIASPGARDEYRAVGAAALAETDLSAACAAEVLPGCSRTAGISASAGGKDCSPLATAAAIGTTVESAMGSGNSFLPN
jgi:hypothetical protein